MIAGRIGKWILVFSEFSFQYVPHRAIKGQAIANFLVEHQESQDEIINILGTLEVARAGIVIIDPKGAYHFYSFLLDYQETTNNWAEYEALIIGLEILIELGATEVEVFGDSDYWGTEISVNHIPRRSNAVANEMAQLASGALIQERKYKGDIEVQKRNLPFIFERGFNLDVMIEEVEEESMRVMAKVHEGIYEAHQAGTNMRWLLRNMAISGQRWRKIAKFMPEGAKNAKDMDLSNMCLQYP
ncbi:uncharacterized protein [Malus domestica]|uniref:uncharacterized protein n=1 Tax=Malus domestica TaxID=3750 RepID=UPI0010AA83D9|nr:uncharacterized protein LOC108172411 [Malus domestica]